MAVKLGCFAVQRDQNLSPKSISTFLSEQLQKHPDAWQEGVLLPPAFACYATKVFCPPWYWNRGPGWLSSQGVFAIGRDQNLSPNQQLFEGATPETT